jgi:CHAT domain-containing protein/tetratricopeptide (TPR) repeat protein
MKSHPVRRVLFVLVLLACLSSQATSMSAAPLAQDDDPVTQCAEGVQLYLDGDYTEALPLLEAGFIGRDQATFANPDDLGTCALILGRLRDDTGNPSGALEAYAVALEIFIGSGSRGFEGMTLNNIGAVHHAQGQYTEALEYYQRALAIQREVDDRAMAGTMLNNIGLVYDAQGQYSEALEAYQQALAIVREVGNQPGEGTTLNNIGGVYRGQGQYAEALDYCQQALAITHKVGDQMGEGVTLGNIGVVYQEQNKLDQALAYYEQAMDIFESVRAVSGSEVGRASFIAQHASLYDHAIALYYQLDQAEQTFCTSERGRARAFLDSLATGHVELSDDTAADLLAREQGAYAARQAAQDALARARALDPPDPTLVAELEAQLAQAEEEYQAALDAIEERGDQLAALVPSRGAVLDLAEVQALLDDQTTLISFWVLEDQTLAFVLTRDDFHTVALEVSQADLTAQIRTFRNFSNLDMAHPESVVTLYEELIAPLKPYLAKPHLAIVPHSVLHYLPFATLTDGQHYLVDDYAITYLPSASTLPFIQANLDGAGGEMLILGNPATGDTELKRLVFAEREAQAIGELYDVEPALKEAATENLVREQASQVGILHLTAHGEYNRANPLYSAIILAPEEESDGLLEVHEVYGLDLHNTDLVVLSACETQLGEPGAEGQLVGISAGDEVVGLTRAFFFAGTPSVIASLWSVDDQSTGMLMERFYGHWQEGMGKAEALRQAQLDVRAEYPNPYYWAGFVLSGDSEPVGNIKPESTPTPPPATPGCCLCWSISGALVAILVLSTSRTFHLPHLQILK